MRVRQFTAGKLALAAALLSGLAFMDGPAQAVGTTTAVDGDGVDYDAACLQDMSTLGPPPNSIASPGVVGCTGSSVYDGSTEPTDLRSVTLSSNAAGQIVGNCYFDGEVPPAGSPVFSALDSPAPHFTGTGCKVMFQNKDKQTNIPTNPIGGCIGVGLGLQSFDMHGSWKDGYHFFVGYEVNWDGTNWIHSAQIGTYDPAPDGGFVYQQLGYSDAPGAWHDSDVNMVKGVDWDIAIVPGAPGSVTITVDGITKTSDPHCVGGVFKTAYATPGDEIVNMKGMTHAQNIVTLPMTVPLAMLCAPTAGVICATDFTTVGGELYFSDTTDGNSTAGVSKLNTVGIAYTAGPTRKAWAGEWLDVAASLAHLASVSRKYGALSAPDTLGEGPSCPGATFGGFFAQNPLFVPDTPWHIDDDPTSRGSSLPEFWETPHGFTF